MTGKAESGNHNLQEKLDKYLILMTKVVSWMLVLMPGEMSISEVNSFSLTRAWDKEKNLILQQELDP